MRPIGILEGEEVCANCKHYVQPRYYFLGHYPAANCGHCHYPRVKHRLPGQTCRRFETRW